MSDQDSLRLLREATAVRVEDLPVADDSDDAKRLLEKILTSRPDTGSFADRSRPRMRYRVGSFRRPLAATVAFAALVGVLVSPPGRSAIGAAGDEIGSWLNGSGAIVDTRSGNQTAAVHADGIITSAAPDGDGGWFIAGGFTAVDGSPRAHLAHIRADGSLDPAWTPSLWAPRKANYTYATLAAASGRVYVAGPFEKVNGEARGNVVALDATTGELVESWNTRVDAVDGITSLAVAGSRLYVGLEGVARIGSSIHRCALALDTADGAADSGFDPQIEPIGDLPCISSLAVSGGLLYLGGAFTAVDGHASQGLAAVDAGSGTLEEGFAPGQLRCEGCPILHPTIGQLAASDTLVYVTGNFTGVGTAARDGVAALNASTGAVDERWQPEIDDRSVLKGGAVLKLELVGNRLYVGGAFKSVDGESRNGFAALNADNGLLLPMWNPPQTTRYVLALALSGSSLFAGGAEADGATSR
jgi:hypothetical protein